MYEKKKPIRCGLGYIVGPGWRPRLFTRRGAERWAAQRAAQKIPKGFWHGVVAELDKSWSVNFAGQPDRR